MLDFGLGLVPLSSYPFVSTSLPLHSVTLYPSEFTLHTSLVTQLRQIHLLLLAQTPHRGSSPSHYMRLVLVLLGSHRRR